MRLAFLIRALCGGLAILGGATTAASQTEPLRLDVPVLASKTNKKSGATTFAPLKANTPFEVTVTLLDGPPGAVPPTPIFSETLTVSPSAASAPFDLAAGLVGAPDSVSGSVSLVLGAQAGLELPADLFTRDVWFTTQVTTFKKNGAVAQVFETSPAQPLGLAGLLAGQDVQPRTVFLGTGGLVLADGAGEGLVLTSDASGNASWKPAADVALGPNTVTSTQIADAAVGTPELADGAVTTSKLGILAVETQNIAPGAVVSGHIAAGAVGATQLADGAVSGSKLANGSVGAIHLTANAVNGNALQPNVVTSDKIALGAVGSAQIQDNSLTPNDLADGAVGAAELQSNAVSESKIATNAVTNTKIADGAVSSGKLASSAVSEAKLATNAVSSTKIVDGAVTGAKVADGAVTSAKLGAFAVTDAKLGPNAVTETKLASGAVTSAKLGTSAVTEDKLTSFAVTSNKIADGAVTAAKISPSGLGALQLTSVNANSSMLYRADVDSSGNNSGDWHRFYKTDGVAENESARIDNVGNLSIDGVFIAGGVDVAELFPTAAGRIAPGTVVAVDPARAEHVLPAERGVAEAVFGIVSSAPGVLLGGQMDGLRPELLAASDEASARGDEELAAELHRQWADVEATRVDRVAVALAGRVPVRVDRSGGPIRAGDRLGLGASAGVAARWLGVGPVVGIAAEDWDGATATLVALCHVRYQGDAAPVMPLVAVPVSGTGSVPVGTTTWVVHQSGLAPDSQPLVTIYGDAGTRHWIAERGHGFFVLAFAQPTTADVAFGFQALP